MGRARSWLGGVLVAVAVEAWGPLAAAADVEETKRACISAAEQGQVSRDEGKYGRARTQFEECLKPECPPIVRESCARWRIELVEATPTIVLSATRAGGQDVSARVFEDDAQIAERLDGRPVMMDPGPHDFRFETGDGKVTVHVLLRAGDRNRLVNAEFPPQPEEPSRATAAPAGLPWPRVAFSLVLLGTGLTGIGIGAGFGLASQGDADRASNIRSGFPSWACATSTLAACSPLASAVDAQRRDATISTVGYVAGGALVAAAAVVWLAWPRGTRMAGSITLSPGLVGSHLGLTASIGWL